MLHGLVQDPGEDMTTYVARALDIATDSTLSVKEQLTRIVKGLHQSDAKNTLTSWLSQIKDLNFDEMKLLVTHQWITTADQMTSENKQPLSGPPKKWCPLLIAKGKATMQQAGGTSFNKKGEWSAASTNVATNPGRKSSLCGFCKTVTWSPAHGKECKGKPEKTNTEQSSVKEQSTSKAAPQAGGAPTSG